MTAAGDSQTEAQRDFYDQYVERQLEMGVNDRHRSILRWLQRFGLRSDQRVLEIGCGVGTLTELIAGSLDADGSLVAVDLSPKSVEAARVRLSGQGNVDFIAGDVLEMDLEGRFDVIVLPDVIEHIPLDAHGELFSRVADWVASGGFVLLHYPNPLHLAWCRENRPEVLQAIDQPIHADHLTAAAYPHGLYLDFLETYSIWVHEGDYQVAVMRRMPDASTFTEIDQRPSLPVRARQALAIRMRRVANKLRR